MNYSDSVKTKLFDAMEELISDPSKYAADPGRDFSRSRKIGIKDLLVMLLTMEGDCIREELYHYFGRTAEAPSKAAFCRQRDKLTDDALRSLLIEFNARLSKKLYNGKYQFIACDGSALDIYRNPDDLDTFFEPNGKSLKGFNQIHINALYSILDRRFTDLTVQPGRKRNEYRAFCDMVDAADPDAPATVYFCDMGYASYNNFAHVIENGQYFLIRCNEKRTAGILGYPLDGVRELDCHVDRILSRSQSKKKRLHPEMASSYRHISKNVAMDFLPDNNAEYAISLRVVRVEITEGCFENIITNLPDIEFDIEDFKDLYHLRWDEENAFRDLKYPLCLKKLHSKKYKFIEQEIWARAVMHNFCSEIAANVDIGEHDTKYEYQINFAESCKTCRDFLRDCDGAALIEVESVIAKNIEPVRPGRTFGRQKRFQLPASFCYRS